MRRLHIFFQWWLIKAPWHILTIVKRLMVLTNSYISFSLNLKLLFTPLFGDYTVVGRCIGFTVRIIEICFGTLIMGCLAIAYVVLPLIWLSLPIFAFIYMGLGAITLYLGLFLLWAIAYQEIPTKRVSEVGSVNTIECFRYPCANLVRQIPYNQEKALKRLLKEPSIVYLLKKAEIFIHNFEEKLIRFPALDNKKLISSCFDHANKNGSRYVELEHLLCAIISTIPNADVFLAAYGSSAQSIVATTYWLVEERERLTKMFLWQEDYETIFIGGFGKGMTGRVTPLLNSMSEDYTKGALKGGYKRFTVRENEIKKIADLLSGSNENILIIGEPGCGKTSIVKGMAYKIMESNKYKSLSNKRIVSVNLAGIVSGTYSLGDIAKRLKGAIEEAKGSGDIILFIDEIHTLVSGGGNNAETSAIYSILEPELSANEIQFIAATNIQNYRKHIEPNGAFTRLFNIVDIAEATKQETIEILKYDVRTLESREKITVTYPALEKAVDLSAKLIHERVLPDKAIQVIGRAATRAASTNKYLDAQTVALEIAEMTHIPAEQVTEDEAQKLLGIENEMKKMVIGQDHAIKQIGAALKRARAGVRNENKPIASFLFVGTTGVGKTQTAKALAKTYFGNSKNMIRLDMSEYQQLDSISRLLGTPDGSTKGILTETVRTKPFALLLLDEVEKAHPNILLTFLQVLDDGRLTDPTGLVVDFTNTIIIATSNVGTRSIQQVFEKGGGPNEMAEVAMKDVRNYFAPEFLNRFTGLIVFNPLSIDNLKGITNLLLADVTRATDAKGIKVSFKPEITEELIKRGYNPEWGARPMARVIEDTIESYLAEKILSKSLKQGDVVELGNEVFNV